MVARSAGLSAVFALAANAFLLPPDVSIEGISSGVPGAMGIVDPFTQLLKVPCPGCQFATVTENGLVIEEAGETSLLFNISVGSDPTTLEMNSVQFYPPPMLNVMPAMPSVPHVKADVSLDDIRSNPNEYISTPHPVTSWMINAVGVNTVSEDGHELIEIEVQVSSLAGTAVNIPRLEISTIKDPEARLMIAKIDVVDADKPRECHTLPIVCKWRDILMAKFQGARQKMGKMCHGKGKGKPSHGPPGRHHGLPPPPHGHPPHGHPPHGPGHHHKHHGHGHYHGRLHRFAHAMKWIVFAVVIGALAAATLYIMAVAIGYGVAAVWCRLRRGRRGAYQPIALDDEDCLEASERKDEEAAQEKAELEVNEVGEAPPQYTEAVARE